MTILDLIIAALSTFRITSLFYQEDGPFRIFELIRRKFNIYTLEGQRAIEISEKYNFGQELLSCFWCTSVYISGIVFILNKFKFGKVINTIMALSSVAIFINEKME